VQYYYLLSILNHNAIPAASKATAVHKFIPIFVSEYDEKTVHERGSDDELDDEPTEVALASTLE
jgi:hypothetical protein